MVATLERFPPRSMFATAVHGGKAFLMGGWAEDNRLFNDVWTSENGIDWTRVCAEAPWVPRCYVSATSFRGRLWIAGGFLWAPPSNVLADVWSSADGREWEEACRNPPWEAREHNGFLALGNRLFLFGGVTYLRDEDGPALRAFSDVWSSADGIDWQLETATAPWGPRRGFGYAVHDGRLWLYGGFDSHDRLYNDVWSSPDGRTWELMAAKTPWTPRGTFFSGSSGGRLWLMGGNVRSTGSIIDGTADVWSSADGVNWTEETAAAPWQPRAGERLIVMPPGAAAERMLIVGGFQFNPDACFFDDAWATSDGREWRSMTFKCLDGTVHSSPSGITTTDEVTIPAPNQSTQNRRPAMHWMSDWKSGIWLSRQSADTFVDHLSDPSAIGNLIFNQVFHRLIEGYFTPGQHVVDVGCGPGLTSFFLHDRGCKVTSVDISEEMLIKLHEIKGDRDIETRQGSGFDLPAGNAEFDAVVSRMFVHQFPDYQMILREFARVVRPGGHIVFNFSNAEHYDAAERWGTIDKAEYPLTDDLSGPHFNAMTDRAGLRRLCLSMDLEVVRVMPLGLLYDNAIVAASAGSGGFRNFQNTLADFLKRPDVLDFVAWLDTAVTPYLPPTMTCHNVTVLRRIL